MVDGLNDGTMVLGCKVGGGVAVGAIVEGLSDGSDGEKVDGFALDGT